MDKFTFSNKLKELLKQKNMTQKELSVKSQVDKGLICRYIKGEAIPKQDNLIKIANALNMDISAFYNIEQNNKNVNYAMIDLRDFKTNKYISTIPFYYKNEKLDPSEFVALKSSNCLKYGCSTFMDSIIYIQKTDILVNHRLFLLKIDDNPPALYTVYSKGQGYLQLIFTNNFRVCTYDVNIFDNDIEIIGQVLKIESIHAL